MASVLDASALLAYLHDEPGADVVTDAVGEGAVISVVNWAETLSKLTAIGDPTELAKELEAQGLLGSLLEIVPLTDADAVKIAELYPDTRDQGLSLGDRACIATALRLGLPVVTAERIWSDLEIEGLSLTLIR